MKKVIFSIIVTLSVIVNCNAEKKPIQTEDCENVNTNQENIDPQDCHCNFDAIEKFARENGYSSIAEYEEAELKRIMN